MAQPPRLRVAIIGNGVAGAALALGLIKYPDIQVDVYEAAPTFTEIGAGISMTGRSPRILAKLGVGEELDKIMNGDKTVFVVKKGDEKEATKFHMLRSIEKQPLFHRAEFLEVFFKFLPKSVTHFGKSMETYVEDKSTGLVTMHFADGTTATADVMFGADGIKSRTRVMLLEEMMRDRSPEEAAKLTQHLHPVWSGTIAYRGLALTEKLRSGGKAHPACDVPQLYVGKNKHLLTYPVSRGKYVNLLACVSDYDKEGTPWTNPWTVPISNEGVIQQFEGWSEEVTSLFENAVKMAGYTLFMLNPLPAFSHGRIALLGDAAHATVPHIGSGAGQGIEDAYVLIRLLSDPRTQPSHIPTLLKAYDAVRVSRAKKIINMSIENGRNYDLCSSNVAAQTDMAELAKTLDKTTQWIWDDNSDEDLDGERAVRMLHGSPSKGAWPPIGC